VERRISAILATDMVGFSRLMEADEIGTLERQKAHLSETIAPKIIAHGGTIIKLTGDGLIAEFPSAVEAVKCAVSFQSDMFDLEINEPEERRIRYRVAINLGDVIFDEGDIYGDGVNIAARLEGLAEPSGIVVSGATFDMLKNQVAIGYKFLGEKHLKNIETPVRVYQVIDTPKGSPVQSGKRLSKLVVAATTAAVVLVVGLFFWWSVQPSITAADPAKIAFSLPEKPSIAVAPFASASGGSLSSSLSEGLVASLISTLTISRHCRDFPSIDVRHARPFHRADFRKIRRSIRRRWLSSGQSGKAPRDCAAFRCVERQIYLVGSMGQRNK